MLRWLFGVKYHITKLQSGCHGQAAPPFKQLLHGHSKWGTFGGKMKKLFSLVLLCFIFMGCTSAKLISSTTIPSEKETVYISFDNTQATVSTGGFVVGNTFFAGTDTASFNTLENRMLTKTLLIEKGYKVTQKIENADMILYGGCESSEIQSVVTLLLVDVKTEEEYVLAKGTYGMGMDLKGDMKGALKNALKSIPNK